MGYMRESQIYYRLDLQSVIASDELRICQGCGAVVAETLTHDQFHERIEGGSE